MSTMQISNNHKKMIEEQIIRRRIKDKNVIQAISDILRELFVPKKLQELSYVDSPLSIGYGQTISQPYIVALMTEAANITSNSKVLEIGTGSGYQTAILSKLSRQVFTIEVIKSLSRSAEKKFKKLGYNNIHARIDDGYKGWPEEAPFDIIIITAAPGEMPSILIEQLSMGGRLVIPVGRLNQELLRIIKTPYGIKQESLLDVRFVPMVKS